MTIGEFATAVRDLCQAHSCSVTSWIRTAKHNAAVGSVHSNSCHQLEFGGMGADLLPDDNTLENRMAIVADAHVMGLQALNETTHVHVQFKVVK